MRRGHVPWPVPYIAIVVVLAVVACLIVTSRGEENRVMDLNNSGVWVTNDARALWGRANRSAGALDAALVDPNRESGGVNLDVFQDGEAVLAWNMSQLRVFPIETRDAIAATNTPIGMGMVGAMAMAGGVVASITSDKGEVRTTTYDPTSVPDVAGLGADRTAAATLDVVSGLRASVDVAVDSQGRVFAASASGGWVLIDTSGAATYGSVGQALRSVAVSLVGGVGVIADSLTGDVFLTNGVHVEVGAGVVPQQPSEDTRVIVAASTGLTAISPEGGTTSLYTTTGAAPGATQVIAKPVVMGTVVYAAWSGTPGRVVRMDASGPREDIFPLDGSALVKPVFRVNRGSVVLNDMANGAVFDVDEKWAMDNWEDVAPEATELSGEEEQNSEDSPQARDDHIWVRPGRASVLHVLDNDDNPGTGIVAITAVSGQDAGSVAISPDGQTLVANVGSDQADDMTLRYTVTNRAVNEEEADEESSATVTISMRAPGENSRPYQESDQGRDETTPDFWVASGASLTIAPAGWWRDEDSDQVSVISASVADVAFPVTAQGLIQYTAPVSPGQITQRLDYMVSDGIDPSVSAAVYIRVQGSSEVQSVPPRAMSDSVRGVAGEPVVFYPLDNDVPGCDPLDKQAHLALASPVGARVGMQVSTDLLTGAVSVTAEHEGAYFLDYVASFGSGFSAGKIRVDISADDQLVAIPDTAVVHGTVPVVVDVLSNDRDRLGSVLTVMSATPRDPDRVRVGVMQGRWLTINLTSSVVDATPSLIDYVVTNGLTSVTGQVSVTQTTLPDVDQVSVVDDVARVRVGDVTTIGVLDNDTSLSGAPLVLNDNVAGMGNAGQLRVEDLSAPTGQQTDVGRAFVDGKQVRYEAPTSGESKRVRIEYQAGVASGSPMTGYVWVDVVAEPVVADSSGATAGTAATPGRVPTLVGNSVPTPVLVEARVIVGDAVRVPIGVYGQDPDGDSVTVAGLRTPPKFGRVVTVGADSLTYESYPDVGNTGMDSFQFYVQDRFGAVGIGTVRVGLSAPHDVPPPLGVDDVVTAQPNVSVTVYPTSNDVVALGTGDTRIVVDDPSQAQVDQESASVVMVAPGVDEPAVSLGYHLDAGGVMGTSAQILVRSRVGYLNPPKVTDHAAEIDTDLMASVDVLDDAWDVDGPDEAIRIVSVGSAGSFDGSVVSVPILDRGQVVPFVVEDGDGAQAMAVVFVPSLTDGRPTLVSDGLIRMDRNGTREVELNEFIESPRHQPVFLTLASQVWTAPAAYLDVSVSSDQQVVLRAKSDYVGPAAVTVEVRDSVDATDPAAVTGVVTIPVQIGVATPVLWCPEDVVQVVQGGVSRSVDVAQVCHVWMPTQTEIDQLRYTASWSVGGEGITLTGRDQGDLPSDVITVQALGGSRPGVDSTLVIGIDGYEVTGQLHVQVIPAPKPTMSVSSVADVQQGTTVEVPVTVTSPMLDGVQNLVSVTPVSGPASTVTFDEHTIRVTPGEDSHGLVVFDVIGSDIADDTRTDRQVTGSFTVEVYGRPDPPTPPQPGTQLRSGSAVVTFTPGADNGSPIVGYEVQWDGGTQSCGVNTTCEVPGLTNGTVYRFQVRAVNQAGVSDWSEPGPEVIPNAIPTAVVGLTASTPTCGSVVLDWNPPAGEGTAPTLYHLTWGGADPVTLNGVDTTYTPTGLDNNQPYTFTIVAENEAGMGHQPVTVQGQSSCTPVWSGTTVTVTPQDMGDTAQIRVTWPDADLQGPGPVTYLVTRTGPDGTKQFAPTTETTLGDSGDEITYDGQTYTYHVTATNATGGADHTSDPITGMFTAVSAPAPRSTVGGADAVHLDATGDTGRITLSVSRFPTFRDSTGQVNATIGTYTSILTPTNPSRTLDGLTNGQDLTASFTACNTHDLCNTPQNVTLAGGSFGPLTAPTISATPGAGRTVCVTASGNGNGRGATLIITADNTIGEIYHDTTLTVTNLCIDALTWDTPITFTTHLQTTPTTPNRPDSPTATTTTRSAIGTPDPWEEGMVTATLTAPDASHSADVDIVTLTVNRLPALNGGTPTVSYTLLETGDTGVITPGGSVAWGSARVQSLGEQKNTYSVTLSNGHGTNAPIEVTAAPYGYFELPIIEPEDPQGTKACVRVENPEGMHGAPGKLVISVGPIPETSTVVWESAYTTSDIDHVQCEETGDYNTEMTFHAQLISAPGYPRPNSGYMTIDSKSAIGTPGALSAANISAVPTGKDGEILLQLIDPLPPDNGGPGDYLRVEVTGSFPDSPVIMGGSSYLHNLQGFTNGVPTTLTFTPCNQENCNTSGTRTMTVTAAGPLGEPQLVSGGPVAQISVDKTVCAQFSADANGADATLTVTNNLDSTSKSTHGSGTVVPEQLCVLASGAEAPVVFTATFTDTSTIDPKREIGPFSWTGRSAKDAGPMGTFGSDGSITYRGTVADVCMGFAFNPNGGDINVTITRVNPRSDETWGVSQNVLIRADAPEPDTHAFLCGTVPADGRPLTVHADIVDASAFNRPASGADFNGGVENVPSMEFVSHSAAPTSRVASTNKEVCATFTANGGGATANMVVSDSIGSQTDSGSGSGYFSVTHCATPTTASKSVTFTASLTDPTYGRETLQDTASATSPEDPPSCTATLHPADATTTYATIVVEYSNIPRFANLETQSGPTSAPLCIINGSQQRGGSCDQFSGSGTITYGNDRTDPVSADDTSVWFVDYGTTDVVATCQVRAA